jgi:hypothetical protein
MQLPPLSVLIGDRGLSLSALHTWWALAGFAAQVATPTPLVVGLTAAAVSSTGSRRARLRLRLR